MEVWLIVAGIIILTVLLFFTFLALLYVSGVLQSVDVGAGTPPIPKVTIAYKFAKGSYSNAGSLFSEVTRLAPDSKGIGIYYDNPNMVSRDSLRYAIGAILSEGDVKVEPSVKKEMEAEGFRIFTLPEVTNCVRAKFPYINTLSILIAIKKVYPQMEFYIQEHRLCAYPMVEVYESNFIHFMAPLAKQDEFFVPEAKELSSADFREQSVFREQSLLDTPGGTPSFYEDSSYYDHSPDRSLSRDISEASRPASGPVFDSLIDDMEGIQDSKISSSADYSTSSEVTSSSDVTLPDLSQAAGTQSLQDSGIASAQPSRLESSLVKQKEDRNSEENDSSSSFEEIHADEALNDKAM